MRYLAVILAEFSNISMHMPIYFYTAGSLRASLTHMCSKKKTKSLAAIKAHTHTCTCMHGHLMYIGVCQNSNDKPYGEILRHKW